MQTRGALPLNANQALALEAAFVELAGWRPARADRPLDTSFHDEGGSGLCAVLVGPFSWRARRRGVAQEDVERPNIL